MAYQLKTPIAEKIWLTAKIRMRAESRLREYDRVSNLMIVAMSVLVIGINLFQDSLPKWFPASEYTILLAVFILAMSLVVYGFHFGATATLHRECYLRLQRLKDAGMTDQELTKEYHDVLSAYPNHSHLDYESLIVDETFFRKEELFDAGGKQLKWTWAMLGVKLLHTALIWLLLPTILALSILPLVWIWL